MKRLTKYLTLIVLMSFFLSSCSEEIKPIKKLRLKIEKRKEFEEPTGPKLPPPPENP